MTTALAAYPADPRVEEAIAKIRKLLVPEEQLLAQAVQRRIFALFKRREIAVATTGRFILYRRNMLPGAKVIDVRWQDLRDAQIEEGVFGSTVTITSNQGAQVVSGLRKDEAQSLYRQCQAQEQAWREKNRVRAMEEARARAGGVQIAAASSDTSKDSSARLKQAKTMFDQGLISDAEYESLKSKILGEI
jgi:hypothetical protein